MKKNILTFILLSLLSFSCDNDAICLEQYKDLQRNKCNIVVTENITKNSSFGHNNLKIKGKDIITQRIIPFNPSPRGWNSLADYISIGDTVVKQYGEAIMYVYKKDSIVEMNLVDICDEDFDWDKILNITLRDSIGK